MIRTIVETLMSRASAATIKRRICPADNIPASKASRIKGLVCLNKKAAYVLLMNSGSSPLVITMICRRDIVAGFGSAEGGSLVPGADEPVELGVTWDQNSEVVFIP
jgi:hypothetical protein